MTAAGSTDSGEMLQYQKRGRLYLNTSDISTQETSLYHITESDTLKL